MADELTDYEKAAAGFAANTDLDKLCADIAAQNDRLSLDKAGRKRAMEKLLDQVAAAFAERSRVFLVEEIPRPACDDDDESEADEEQQQGPADRAPSGSSDAEGESKEIDAEARDSMEDGDAPWLIDVGGDTSLVLIKVKTWADDWPVPVAGLKVHSHEVEDGVVHIAGHDVEWKKVGGFRYDAHRRVWVGALECILFRLQCIVQEWMKTRAG